MKLRHFVAILFLLLLASPVVVMPVDHARMTEFCGNVQAGESLDAVRARAGAILGFRTSSNIQHGNSYVLIVHSPLSFGRYVCFVENNQKTVARGVFNAAD